MPHIVEVDADAPWKAQVQATILDNVESIIRDAYKTYSLRLSENMTSSPDVRQQIEDEYNNDVQNIRELSEEVIKAEIQREENARKWEIIEEQPLHVDDINPEFINEQMAIYRIIKNKAARAKTIAMEDNNSNIAFTQNLTSKLIDERPTDQFHDSYGYHTIQTSISQNSADGEIQLRAEKHKKQQEEFHQRAETIRARKRQERQWLEQLKFIEMPLPYEFASFPPSSIDKTFPMPSVDDTSITGINPINQGDIINFLISHDQQWTSMLSRSQLSWSDFPWPVLNLSGPTCLDDLTVEAISEYIFAPLQYNGDRSLVKDRLRDLIRRWHPDRFNVKFLRRVFDPLEREAVKEGAGVVTRILNDLLGKWNDY